MSTSKRAPVAGFIAAAVLAAAIAPGASGAFAATPDDQISIRLSVSDLNMNSEAGAHEALGRIRHAAKAICGDSGEARVSLTEQMQRRACVGRTVEQTVAASNLPTLIAVSQGRPVGAMASAR